MSKTTTELADAVLQDMAVANVRDTPDAEDRNYVIAAYETVWEELAGHGREVVFWTQNEIPLPVFYMMRDLVRLEVQGAYGKPIEPEARDARREMILKRLYRHTQTQSSGLPTRATYY